MTADQRMKRISDISVSTLLVTRVVLKQIKLRPDSFERVLLTHPLKDIVMQAYPQFSLGHVKCGAEALLKTTSVSFFPLILNISHHAFCFSEQFFLLLLIEALT